jgi:hypothetical protein
LVFLSSPGKFRDSTQNKTQHLNSKFFKIHPSLIILPSDAESVVK